MFMEAKVRHPAESNSSRSDSSGLSGYFQQLSGKTKRLSCNKRRKAINDLPSLSFYITTLPAAPRRRPYQGSGRAGFRG